MAKPLRDCVLLMGDSLTCGQEVPDNLVSRFNGACPTHRRSTRLADELHRGVSGYHTSWYLPVMERTLAKQASSEGTTGIRLITIWLGTNDALSPELAPRRGVDVNEFEKNLRTMLERLTSPQSPYLVANCKGPLSIILITPPFVHEPMLDQPPNLTNDRIKVYRDVVLQVGSEWKAKQEGQKWKLASIDLFGALQSTIAEEGSPEAFYTDGVHLSSKGYSTVWDKIDTLVHTDFKGRGVAWRDQRDLPCTLPDACDLLKFKDGVAESERWIDEKDRQPDQSPPP